MRRVLKAFLVIVFSLLSLEAFIWIVDWSGRVQWVHDMLGTHPLVGAVVRGPLFPLICLMLCIVIVKANAYLSAPDIWAKCQQASLQPKFEQVTGTGLVGLVDALNKAPANIDFDLMLRIDLVNRSETAASLSFDGYVKVNGKKTALNHCRDFRNYSIEERRRKYKPNGDYELEDFRTPLVSLLETIGNKPLTRGVRYDGWVGFTVRDLNKHLNHNIKLKLWVVDAFGGKHPVIVKRKLLDSDKENIQLIYH